MTTGEVKPKREELTTETQTGKLITKAILTMSPKATISLVPTTATEMTIEATEDLKGKTDIVMRIDNSV